MKINSSIIKFFLSAVIFYLATGYCCNLSYSPAEHLGYEQMQNSHYVRIAFFVLASSLALGAIRLIRLK